MNNLVKYSIIVPAYNVELFIDDCIKSLTALQYDKTQYEIIIINDGSTDQTLEKALAWKKDCQNIVVLSQENKRQGAARNLGLKHAKGQWILYVDADDWICGKNILNIFDKFTHDDVNFIKSFSFNACSKREIITSIISEPNEVKIFNGSELIQSPTFSPYVWLGCFNKDFLNQLNYPFRENVFYEDTDWYVNLYLKTDKAIFINSKYYCYYYNSAGTTAKTNLKSFIDDGKSMRAIIDIIEREEISDIDEKKIRLIVKKTVKNYLLISRDLKIKDSIKAFKEFKSLGILDSKNYSCSFSEKLYFFINRQFPSLTISAIRFLCLANRYLKNCRIKSQD